MASSLAANAHAQEGYPSQPGGMLGSILGALGKKMFILNTLKS